MSRLRRGGGRDTLAGFRTQVSESPVPAGLLKAARKSGQLNLSGRGLTEVPQSVYRLNVDTPEEAKHSVAFGESDRWWEQTDLTKLLLSSNQLSALSDEISLLAALSTLDLHDNQLSSLPSTMGELKELQQLRLNHNKLAELPVAVCSLKNLCCLTLQQNLLEMLPDELGQLENLTELDLSNNRLKSLPSSLGSLVGLQKLNLSHNLLTCLPDCLSQLNSVRLLELSNNVLTDIPGSLSQMVSLEQLFLRHNKLRLLPQLPAPKLKELYLGNNQLESLGAESLSSLSAICILELRDNKIKALPEEITQLSTLTRLDLTNNDIASLPASLCLLPELKILLLEGNPLRGIRRDILTKGTAELLRYLKGRITEETGEAEQTVTAMTLPSQAKFNLHSIKTLKALYYSDKQEATIPDELFDAAAGEPIVSVNFSSNRLTALPDRLLDLQTSLVEVSSGHNRLTECVLLCSLPLLTFIDLQNNALCELPLEFGRLSKLRSLMLNYNRFKSFPEVLYKMVSLEVLLLGNNQVGSIDAVGLKQLVKLSTLDLSNNDLLNIPPELGLCSSLRCLSLEGNPFRTPRAAIIDKGTDSILEYLRSRIPT